MFNTEIIRTQAFGNLFARLPFDCGVYHCLPITSDQLIPLLENQREFIYPQLILLVSDFNAANHIIRHTWRGTVDGQAILHQLATSGNCMKQRKYTDYNGIYTMYQLVQGVFNPQ